MIDMNESDKKIYFPRSFNEQMAWLGEEIEHFIKHRKNENFKNGYENSGHCHSINRLFEIIKADPKNMAIFREIVRAEKEWNDFINNEPEALSQNEVLKYWNDYMWAYVAELELQPIHYFLMRGHTEVPDGDEWIGVYDSILRLQKDYLISVEELKQKHDKYATLHGYTPANEKVMIHTFNEVTKQWRLDVPADEVFAKRVGSIEKENDKNKY